MSSTRISVSLSAYLPTTYSSVSENHYGHITTYMHKMYSLTEWYMRKQKVCFYYNRPIIEI